MADRGTQSGGSSGGRSRGLPLGAGSQTAKGALLVAAAVVIGIVLLQIVDPGKSGPVAAGTKTTKATSTTSTTAPKKHQTTTTTKLKAAKTPAQVHLLVLNAGAPTGSATTVSTTLRSHGYTNQGKAGNDPTHRVGKEVLCKPGLTREATRLQILLGTGTTKGLITSTVPPGGAAYDCVVLVGT